MKPEDAGATGRAENPDGVLPSAAPNIQGSRRGGAVGSKGEEAADADTDAVRARGPRAVDVRQTRQQAEADAGKEMADALGRCELRIDTGGDLGVSHTVAVAIDIFRYAIVRVRRLESQRDVRRPPDRCGTGIEDAPFEIPRRHPGPHLV